MNIEARMCNTANTQDLAVVRFDRVQTGCRSTYFASYGEYKAHRIIRISPISAGIRSDEYSSLNMQNWKYAALNLDQS